MFFESIGILFATLTVTFTFLPLFFNLRITNIYEVLICIKKYYQNFTKAHPSNVGVELRYNSVLVFQNNSSHSTWKSSHWNNSNLLWLNESIPDDFWSLFLMPDDFWRVPLQRKNTFKGIKYFLGVIRSQPWGPRGLAVRRLPRMQEVVGSIPTEGKIHFSQFTPFMKWNVKNCFEKLILLKII